MRPTNRQAYGPNFEPATPGDAYQRSSPPMRSAKVLGPWRIAEAQRIGEPRRLTSQRLQANVRPPGDWVPVGRSSATTDGTARGLAIVAAYAPQHQRPAKPALTLKTTAQGCDIICQRIVNPFCGIRKPASTAPQSLRGGNQSPQGPRPRRTETVLRRTDGSQARTNVR